eukprot:6195725-Pleurochrysis_carterae.AAC.4
MSTWKVPLKEVTAILASEKLAMQENYCGQIVRVGRNPAWIQYSVMSKGRHCSPGRAAFYRALDDLPRKWFGMLGWVWHLFAAALCACAAAGRRPSEKKDDVAPGCCKICVLM